MAKNSRRKDYKDYVDFIDQVGHGQLDLINVSHAGWPLSVAESKFIDTFVLTGNLNQALKDNGLRLKDVAGKDYIVEEIKWRLNQLTKLTIADADEIMQFFTAVMRGEVKDQFGLEAPLSERTAAARELAKRIIDVAQLQDAPVPEIKITLNWDN